MTRQSRSGMSKRQRELLRSCHERSSDLHQIVGLKPEGGTHHTQGGDDVRGCWTSDAHRRADRCDTGLQHAFARNATVPVDAAGERFSDRCGREGEAAAEPPAVPEGVRAGGRRHVHRASWSSGDSEVRRFAGGGRELVEEWLSRDRQGLTDEHRAGEVEQTRPGTVELVVAVALQQPRSFECPQLPQRRAGNEPDASCRFGEAQWDR